MRRTLRTPVTVGALAAVFAVPMLIALGVLHDPHWFTMSDTALLEMRVRDVGTAHSPLVGLSGRFESEGVPGNHPGPLAFYALWPLYQVLGADGWALQAATVTLNTVGVGVAIWMAHRRGGWRFALATTAALALLVRGYEPWRMAEPWTPYLGLVWWVVFLLAVWAVLSDDLPMLPVAALAGSICLQNHVSYGPLVGGLAVLTLAVLGVRWRAAEDPEARRRVLRWVGLTAAAVVVLWLPPLVDQVIHEPGNLAVIVGSFREPPADQIPFGEALQTWIAHLDLGELVTTRLGGAFTPRGSVVLGIALLVGWAATVVIAWRRRSRDLLWLHLVVGVALLSGLVAMSRIFGPLWGYLTLWAWGTTVLMLLAGLWTLATSFDPVPTPVVAALGGAAAILGILFAVDASAVEMPDAQLARTLGPLTDAVEAGLDDDPARCGDDCQYLLTWQDPVNLASQGFGMLVELERRGLPVRADPENAQGVRAHRTMTPSEADAEIRLVVTTAGIEAERERPEVEELAYVDPHNPEQRAEYWRRRTELVEGLHAEGFHRLAEQLADPVNGTGIPGDERMSERLRDLLNEVNGYYRPSAVFLVVPGSASTTAG